MKRLIPILLLFLIASSVIAAPSIVGEVWEYGGGKYNINALGAIPNDGIDDTAAIQAALNSATLVKGSVIIPAGEYTVSSPLTIDTDTSIIGDSAGGSILKVTDTPGDCFQILQFKEDEAAHSIDNVTIANFTIDGNYSTRSSTASSQPAIVIQNANNTIVQNVKIINNYQGGIGIWHDATGYQRICKNVKILNCTIKDSGYQADYTPEGIVIASGEDILIDGCTIKNIKSIAGINAESGGLGIKRLRIVNNYFSSIGVYGIQIKSGTSGTFREQFQDVQISNNVINTSRYGINLAFDPPGVPKSLLVNNNIINGGCSMYTANTRQNVGFGEFAYYLDSVTNFHETDDDPGIVLSGDAIPANLWGLFAFEVDNSDDVINVLPAAGNGVGYATESLAIAALPTVTASHIQLGYVTIQAGAATTFVPGTDALQGTGGNPAQTVHYWPAMMSERAGIYGANAVITGNEVKNFNTSGIFGLVNCIMTSNQVVNSLYGIHAYGATSTNYPYSDSGFTIANNNVFNSGTYGIYLDNGEVLASIIGNTIIDSKPTPTMTYGLFNHAGNVTNRVVEGNNYYAGYVTATDNISSTIRVEQPLNATAINCSSLDSTGAIAGTTVTTTGNILMNTSNAIDFTMGSGSGNNTKRILMRTDNGDFELKKYGSGTSGIVELDSNGYNMYFHSGGLDAGIVIDNADHVNIGSNPRVPTTYIPNGWTDNAQAKIVRILPESGIYDVGLFMRSAAETIGLDLWHDNSDYGYGHIDLRGDNDASQLVIRTKTAGTPLTAATIYGAGNSLWGYNMQVPGLGIGLAPSTGKLHIAAGTATAGTAPIKLTSGTVLGTPEAGAIEFNGDVLSFTTTTGPTRKSVAFLESPSFTTPTLGAALATSIQIGANTLDTVEWANLDGLNQALATTSTPQHLRLGLGDAADATAQLNVSSASASPTINITNKSDTNTYDPTIAFRTGASSTTRFSIWLDDSDSDMLKFSPTSATTYPPLILGTTGKSVVNMLDADTEAFVIKEATNSYLTFVTTNGGEKIVAGKDIEMGTVNVDANSGAVDIINMNITGTDAAGTVQSLSTGLDGTKILTVYGETNGSGGLQNPRVGVNTSTPTTDLDVNGDVKLGGASTDLVTMTGRMILRTLASDPLDATPANRPAGSVAEVAYYSANLYFCTDASTPTWKQLATTP